MNTILEPMPGAWACDKCHFVLQKNVLYTCDGSVSADMSLLNVVCPNDGQLMRPLTWREANEELYERAVKEIARSRELEAQLDEARTRLNQVQQSLDRVETGLAQQHELAQRLEAACAEMRQALEFIGCRTEHPDDSKLPGCPICMRIERALSTDAGKTILARLEEARVLLNRANFYYNCDGELRDKWLEEAKR